MADQGEKLGQRFMTPGTGGCPRCSGFVQDFLDLLHEEHLVLPVLRCLNCGARRYFSSILPTLSFRGSDLEQKRAEMKKKLERERVERDRAERESVIERIAAGITAGTDLSNRQVRADGRDKKKTECKIEVAKTLTAQGIRRKEAAQILGISLPTLDRWLRA